MKHKTLIESTALITGFILCSLSSKINRFLPNDIFMIDSWLPVLTGFILIIVVLTYTHAHSEAGKIIKGVWAHAQRAAVRVVVISVIALFCLWGIFFDANGHIEGTLEDVLIWLSLTAVGYGVFAVCFDVFYNVHKKEDFFYLGGESWWDKKFNQHPERLFMIDIGVFLLSLYLFFEATSNY